MSALVAYTEFYYGLGVWHAVDANGKKLVCFCFAHCQSCPVASEEKAAQDLLRSLCRNKIAQFDHHLVILNFNRGRFPDVVTTHMVRTKLGIACTPKQLDLVRLRSYCIKHKTNNDSTLMVQLFFGDAEQLLCGKITSHATATAKQREQMDTWRRERLGKLSAKTKYIDPAEELVVEACQCGAC